MTAFLSQRYSNRDASDASRCRIVLPPRPRCASSSRQAMMCARVTIRNSSGRRMPAKRMKSLTAVSYARRVLGFAQIGEPLDLGWHVGKLVELGGGQHPRSTGGGNRGGKLVAGHGLMAPVFQDPLLTLDKICYQE